MRAATEGSLPPVMTQGNLVEVLGHEVRQGSPGELMVESSPSRQRQPPCQTNKEKSDEAADAAALTYLLTLARPAANNISLSEHETQELRRLLYLKAEGIERQQRLQYLRQTCKSSIWSEEDDDSYTLPDPEIPLVHSLHYGQQCSPEWDDGSVPAETADWQKKQKRGKSNLHAEEEFLQKLESLNLDPRLKKLLITYEEVFGALPLPLSCKELVVIDLKLKPSFKKTRVRRRPYPAPQEQVEEIERQIQECIDAGLAEEYKKGDYPHHCSPCFLVAKPGSTALRLVVDYGEVNKKTQNHSGSIPNMENTLERIAKCRYKTKMDKPSGF